MKEQKEHLENKKENEQNAPIVLFTYNRPEHTRKTLEALSRNRRAGESELFVYSDGPRDAQAAAKVQEVRAVVRARPWCGKVHLVERERNYGLGTNIRTGVTEVIRRCGKAIVLEDDLVTAPFFLDFMNEALALYANDERVMHVSGFLPLGKHPEALPETFFLRFMGCSGWATWEDRWQKADFDFGKHWARLKGDRRLRSAFNLEGALKHHRQLVDNIEGRIHSWAIGWYATIFFENGLCLYPNQSLVENIGMDNSGENSPEDARLEVVMKRDRVRLQRQPVEESAVGRSYLRDFYEHGKGNRAVHALKAAVWRVIYAYRSLAFRLKRP